MSINFNNKILRFNNKNIIYTKFPNGKDLAFLVDDMSIVKNGRFVDVSGKNKILTAATTNTANDSIIMPANDTDIITALTYCGLYSIFYTNNSTPKTVLLSDIPNSTQFNNHFYDEKNNRVWALYTKYQNEDTVNNVYGKVFGNPLSGGYIPIWTSSDSFSFVLKGSGSITFDWNDGTTNTYTLTSNTQTISHTYSTKLGKEKNIRVTGNWHTITYLLIANTVAGSQGFRITNLPITYLSLTTYCKVVGNITRMPLTYLYIYSLLCKIDGNITGKSLTNLYLRNTITNITGDITGMPLTYLYLSFTDVNAPCSVYGDISNITSLQTFYLYRCPKNNIYGDISNLSNITFLGIVVYTKVITGSLDDMTGLTYIQLNQSPNINISGSITNKYSLAYLVLNACPLVSLTGDITNNSWTSYFRLTYIPLSNISGPVEVFPNISVNIALPSGQVGPTYQGGVVKANTQVDTYAYYEASWTTEMVDGWLNSYALVATNVGARTIYLAGSNEPRSSASDDAVLTLQGLGKTIVTTL